MDIPRISDSLLTQDKQKALAWLCEFFRCYDIDGAGMLLRSVWIESLPKGRLLLFSNGVQVYTADCHLWVKYHPVQAVFVIRKKKDSKDSNGSIYDSICRVRVSFAWDIPTFQIIEDFSKKEFTPEVIASAVLPVLAWAFITYRSKHADMIKRRMEIAGRANDSIPRYL